MRDMRGGRWRQLAALLAISAAIVACSQQPPPTARDYRAAAWSKYGKCLRALHADRGAYVRHTVAFAVDRGLVVIKTPDANPDHATPVIGGEELHAAGC